MTTAQLIIICLTVLAALHLLHGKPAAAAADTDELDLKLPEGADVALLMPSGNTFRGRVIANGPVVHLADVMLVVDGQQSAMGGTVRVPADGVELAQVLTPPVRTPVGVE